MSPELSFVEDSAAPAVQGVPWRVLVVDDDPEVHAVTRLAMTDCVFEDRPVQILCAHSGAEARAQLAADADIALVLLDVVMETEHAGLDLVRYIREELHNAAIRIVLRTGQPGRAPAREVIVRYEIDDYVTKTELTFDRLHIVVLSSLRTYRLLRQMEHRERALSASNEELERFAYVASHDLQAPLRGISGFTQLLQKRYESKLDGDAKEFLGYIVRGTNDMQTLIRNLLEFSRVGRVDTDVTAVDLNETVRMACSTLSHEIKERGAVVDTGPLPVVDGNAAQLEQLFTNLIQNAIKFQPGAAPQVMISASSSPESWEIRVADCGIGIGAKFLEQIFEIFRRLHTTDSYPGAGIGLSICRKIAQFHHGAIRAESTPGQGTTMIVTLPRHWNPPV